METILIATIATLVAVSVFLIWVAIASTVVQRRQVRSEPEEEPPLWVG